MERAIPIPSAEELQAEAEAKFPLYKLGENGEWTAYADGVTVTKNNTS